MSSQSVSQSSCDVSSSSQGLVWSVFGPQPSHSHIKRNRTELYYKLDGVLMKYKYLVINAISLVRKSDRMAAILKILSLRVLDRRPGLNTCGLPEKSCGCRTATVGAPVRREGGAF